jgi:hypothetical protein
MTAAWDLPCLNSRAAANRRASSAALRRAPRCGVVMPQHRMVLDDIHHFISRDSLVVHRSRPNRGRIQSAYIAADVRPGWEQSNFHQYQITRMAAAPKDICVGIVPGDYAKPMGGVGEPRVPPLPSALCHAIYAATGKRIRWLPIVEPAQGPRRSERGGVGTASRRLVSHVHANPLREGL